MHFDVFNGDADGIIALTQLRLAEPKDSQLITGIKRDIALLSQVDVAQAESVTVLDISMEKNQTALQQLLAHDVSVFYVDHHRSGEIPEDDNLTAIIDTQPNTCTSLLVNQYLKHRYPLWTIAAAFGDNMTASAIELANSHGLTATETEQLKALGIYVNYNGYGRSVNDLHIHPATLFQQLVQFENPLALVAQSHSVFDLLASGYHDDMQKAQSATTLFDDAHCQVIMLDDAPWARRISGVLGNELANNSPDKAHVVLTHNSDHSYTVSIRAPLNNKQGADIICSQFATGGGRAAAAGINALPRDQVEQLIDIVSKYYK